MHRLVRAAFLAAFVPSLASAHFELDSPLGGEVFTAGDVVTLEWHVTVTHDQTAWDISYSVNGDAGPFVPIATIPGGAPEVDSVHQFVWTVPDEPTQELRLRVFMVYPGSGCIETTPADVMLVGSPLTDCNANALLDTDEIVSGSANDFNLDGRPDECQPFSVDVATLSLSNGGAQSMTLAAGAALAGDFYWVFGSATGTSPGLSLPGGDVLPLVFDAYTALTVKAPGAAVFDGFLGVLDAQGRASAALDLPAGLDPSLAGITLYHAYLTAEVLGVPDTASNAMPVLLVP